MNRSKIFRLSALLLSLLVLFSCFLFAVNQDRGIFAPDTWGYCNQIETGHIHNWWSVLFMYEAVFIKKAAALAGIVLPARVILKIIWAFSNACILVCLCTWIVVFFKRKSLYCILGLVLGVVVLIFSDLKYYRFYYYIDCPFLASVLLCITLVFLLKTRCQAIKVASLVCFLVSLAHVILLRKNAICLAPVLMTGACVQLYGWQPRPWLTLARSLGYTILFVLVTLSASSFFLPAKRMPSALPLMVSDLKTAAIIRGDNEEVHFLLTSRYLTEDLNQVHSIGPEYWVRVQWKMSDEEWKQAKLHYISQLKAHPDSMLVGKLVQYLQFMTNGYVPEWTRRAICLAYPDLPVCGETWNWEENGWWTGSGRYERPVIYSISLVALLYFIQAAIRRRGDRRIVFSACLFGGTAFCYLASFVPFTPTPDPRYHTLPLLCSCICSTLALLHAVGQLISFRRSSFISPENK